jgi:hypothetical protein
MAQVSERSRTPRVADVIAVSGFSIISGASENVGLAVVVLEPVECAQNTRSADRGA